jgi:hypothetical protein
MKRLREADIQGVTIQIQWARRLGERLCQNERKDIRRVVGSVDLCGLCIDIARPPHSLSATSARRTSGSLDQSRNVWPRIAY